MEKFIRARTTYNLDEEHTELHKVSSYTYSSTCKSEIMEHFQILIKL